MKIIIFFSILVISILLLVFPVSVMSMTSVDTLDKRTSLDGKWKIKLGDKKEFASPDYDDSKWDEWNLPGAIAPYVIKENPKQIEGIVWIRRDIFVSDRLKGEENMGLILGRIANADETYFNGIKIGGMGKFPPNEFSMWNHPRHYLVPGSIIRYGKKNVISVRIYSYVFNEVLGTLAVTNYRDWQSNKTLQNFFTITVNFINIFMGVPLFLMFFLIYIRRQDEEYLYYCLQLICGLFIVLEVCNYWNIYYNTLIRLKILMFSWVAINVVHPIFLHRIYDLKRKKMELLLWIYLGIIFIILIFIKGKMSEQFIVRIMIFLTTCIGFYNISCHISALYKRSPYAKLFSLFGITVILASIHDGIVYLSKFSIQNINFLGYTFERMLFSFGAAALYIGTALVLIHRFINTLDDNDDLINTLENFFLENTFLQEEMTNLKKKYSSINLTHRFEKKIKKVIEYVEDNYRFDISREGLAASVDVHPDNLGKLFLKYTNKKLGDYINELRIKDAAQQLVETDDTILDIALSVGFENLRTFNRLFPKFMNYTPYNYRKKYQDKSEKA